MRNGVQRERQVMCVVFLVVCVCVLAAGKAMAQIPVQPTPTEERVITGNEQFRLGVHNIVTWPLDVAATVGKRVNGKRSNYYGLALLTAPVEGLSQGVARLVAGLAGAMTAPVAQSEALMYEYERGTSGIDPALSKAGRGLFNIVKGPVDIPVAFFNRASDRKPRYYGYAVASAPLEGAAQGSVRMGMGLLETLLAPFPPYDLPFYEYELGFSVADPGIAKAGFGMYHIASSPIDIPAAVLRRVNGQKPAHSGFAVVASPVEGLAEGATRSVVGGYYLLTWVFPQYPTTPPYDYLFGTSYIDPGLEGFMRGGENVEISPAEIPVTGYQAVMDRGLIYGVAYGSIMGPTRMVVRIAAGLGEMITMSVPDFEPVYDVKLTDPLPNMTREQPRLKRPVHEIVE